MVTETVYLEQEEARRQKEAKEAQARAAAAQITQPPKAAAATPAASAPTSDQPSAQSQPMGFDNLNPVQQSLAMLFFFLALLLDPEKLAGSGLDKLFGSILGLDPDKGQSFGTWQQDALRSGKSSSEIARGHDYRNFNFAQAATLAASDTPILELIGKHESGGDYNNYYGRNKKGESVNFSNMSVDQVLAWQRDHTRNDGYASSAAGKYQIIQKTLEACKKEMGLTGNEKFDPALQDRMAVHLLNKRGYQSFLSGKMSAETFATNISKEWASLPKDASGLSYYHGDGLNKSGVGWGTLLASVQASRNGVRSPAADAALAANGGPVTLSLPLNSIVTSDMGPRQTNIKGASDNHGGIDMRAAVGTPLIAQGPAQVAYAGPSGGYGQAVILNHGQGVFTLYGHVEPNMPVKTGQMVQKGQKFALTGDEGIGAAHLHYEVLLLGRDGRAYRVDPEQTVGKNLADPTVRQQLIEHAAHKMGVAPSQLASRAFDARVDDGHKHTPTLVAQNQPQPEAPKPAAREPVSDGPRTASAASAALGAWLAKELPGLANIFTGEASRTTTQPGSSPTAAAVARVDDEHKPHKPAVAAPALA